ncbi:MAG: hypothetical protein ABSG44_03420 [Thermodesulfobacteriota bacterium]
MCLLRKSLFLPLIFCFFLLSISPSTAETVLRVPAQYGKVIYQLNEKSPSQLFIIALGHRDTVTCLNGDNTSRVQAEVYKIGDWLIHDQGLGLLLPEGFFKSTSTKVEKRNITTPGTPSSCALLDMKALVERLSVNTAYVNAEMLLKETHPLRLRQVEDKGLYDAVRNNLFKLISCREDSSDYSLLKSKLDYLQEKRTAAMLQKIPGIVDDEFQRGNIKTRKAILTVGLSHLPEIIRYLNGNRIMIRAPLPVSNGTEDYNSEVNLLKEHFGVSVILPTTLAGDQKVLEITGLDGIVRQCQSNP